MHYSLNVLDNLYLIMRNITYSPICSKVGARGLVLSLMYTSREKVEGWVKLKKKNNNNKTKSNIYQQDLFFC